MIVSDVYGLPEITRQFRGGTFRIPAHPIVTHLFNDEAEIRDAHWLIRPGDVVVDVGSHFGSYTIPALALGATVYAADPDAEVSAVLKWIWERNPDLPGRLVMLREALADHEGLTPFFRHALGQVPHPSMATPLDCAYTSLDKLAGDHHLTRLDWVKIDVEGLELAVLRGGEKTFREFGPTVLMEDHTGIYPFVGEMGSTRLCLAFLEGLGYRCSWHHKWLIAEKAT